MNEMLMIFVKNLIPGMVKTRLADDIGIDKALDVYMELVNHTNKITKKLEMNKAVYYSLYVEVEDVWDTGGFELGAQKGETLGEKMSIAFDEAFDSNDKVVLIGSDCYELTTKIIESAFVMLEDHDVVVGPAKDGGFYLIGMKEYYPQLFQDKVYSTDTVLKDLLETAEELDLSVYQLPTLSDIDVFTDLKSSGMDWENLGEEGEMGGEEDMEEGF